MFKLGNIQVLCGARAGLPTRDTEEGGVFTRQLLVVLSQPHEPSLLALPFDLASWHNALPENLLKAPGAILGDREVLGGHVDERPRPPGREPEATPAAGDAVIPGRRGVLGEQEDEPPERKQQASAA